MSRRVRDGLEDRLVGVVTVAVEGTVRRILAQHRDQPMLPALMTQTDAAVQLGCSRGHVADLIDRGELDALVEGGRRKVRGPSLLAYIDRLDAAPARALEAVS